MQSSAHLVVSPATAAVTLDATGASTAKTWYIYGADLVGQHPDGKNPGYYYRDHLGSVRVTTTNSGSVVGADGYYPYGLQTPGRSMTGSSPTRENYTGHELYAETGLLYAGARYYGAALE